MEYVFTGKSVWSKRLKTINVQHLLFGVSKNQNNVISNRESGFAFDGKKVLIGEA